MLWLFSAIVLCGDFCNSSFQTAFLHKCKRVYVNELQLCIADIKRCLWVRILHSLYSSFWRSRCYNAFSMREQPQNCPFPWGDQGPHLINGSVGPESKPKRQLDRSSRLCRVHPCVQQTDTQTDHATSIAMSHILCSTQQCSLIIITMQLTYDLFSN